MRLNQYGLILSQRGRKVRLTNENLKLYLHTARQNKATIWIFQHGRGTLFIEPRSHPNNCFLIGSALLYNQNYYQNEITVELIKSLHTIKPPHITHPYET